MYESLLSFTENYAPAFVALHLFAMVLGLGGATYSDILLMRFLKDYKISHKEAEVIQTMAHVILIGIVLAFISGVLLFLPKSAEMLDKPKFLVKCLIFFIVTANGFFLHRILLPKMIDFSFHREVYLIRKLHLRQIGFIAGAISLVSWYSIFLLGSFKNVPFSFGELLGTYVFILAIAIITALGVEKKIQKHARKKP